MIKLKDLLNIKEASGLGSALGGKVNPVRKAGYKSAGATSAQSDYKLKKADYGAKSAQYDTALAAKDDSKRYRKNIGTVRRPAYTYSGSPIKGGETNPDWTNWDNMNTEYIELTELWQDCAYSQVGQIIKEENWSQAEVAEFCSYLAKYLPSALSTFHKFL